MPSKEIEQRRATWRAHYARNKEKYYQLNIRKRQKLKDWYDSIKANLQCPCGENHPACLAFHHRDPSQKEFNLAECVNKNYSKKKILAEMEKCDVLCHNCHSKLHWK